MYQFVKNIVEIQAPQSMQSVQRIEKLYV